MKTFIFNKVRDKHESFTLIAGKNLTLISIPIIFILLSGCTQRNSEQSYISSPQEMKADFQSPPENVKPWVYYYWINNHISKEGITKDLEAMAKLGIGAALIGNIYLDGVPEDGNVPMLSEKWKALTKHAIREGGRLGVDIGLFNSPGWSQSGGPWNDESNSMRYLTSTEFQVQGGKKISMQLKKPTNYFGDVSLLAFPSKTGTVYKNDIFKISADKNLSNLKNLLDGDTATTIALTGIKEVNLVFEGQEPVPVRSLKIFPSRSTFVMDVKLLAEINGKWTVIRSFEFDRRNAMDQLGYDDYPPVVVSFPKINAKKFKLELSNITQTRNSKEIGLSEISFSSQLLLDFYIEKKLAKMHQTPLPLEDAYKWPDQPEITDNNLIVNPEKIVDISDKLSDNGVLNWDAPAGDWTILRMGMATTGIKNAPAAPNATGLEVDKLNKKALLQHFEGFVGEILNSMPPEEREALKYVVADSYETGSQNWTPGFAETFQKTYGYDPKPYLPVLTGRIVKSVDESNRFLWDLRRLVADEVAYEYVGGLRELCEEHGLKLWLENYGHWGFPSEFLMYGGQSHLIGGEFWAEGDLGSIECRAASSAGHIYGKNQISAESYTAAGKPYLRHPGMLKKRGDWSFTEGINHVVFHVYIQQAYNKVPGVNAWFGTEFNRNNTWFNEAGSWIDYQRRCMFMLQQGRYVADVAYFIGEDVPKMTGSVNPPVPDGYSFDFINAEVIKNRISVKDGRITLPDGLSYRILVLPESETMRPELLEKIKNLVATGAVIMGNPPKRSPSLQNFPKADKKVESLARELWGESYTGNKKVVDHGQGKVLQYMDLGDALKKLGSVPDFKTVKEQPILWIHRKMPNREIYFITNQSDKTISFDASFRVTEMQPTLWDATTGSSRVLPRFSVNENYTQIPLKLEPAQSAFVIFSQDSEVSEVEKQLQNFGEANTLKTIDSKWNVHFKNKKTDTDTSIVLNQLKDWTKINDNKIKYFSGTATYRTSFNLDEILLAKKIFLDIEKANVLANIKLNGKEVGGLWNAPWRIDVTKYLKKGENKLEIEVTNLWVNQLIGYSGKKKEDKKTWTLIDSPYSKDSPLSPSGLVGPVKLVSFDEVYGKKK